MWMSFDLVISNKLTMNYELTVSTVENSSMFPSLLGDIFT